jgi:neogenin
VPAEGKNGEEPLLPRDTDVLSAPRELKAVIQSTRFVTLSWNPPEKVNGPILTYSVFYRQEGSER